MATSRNDYGGYNDARMVVPLNTWILISQFKLAYNLLRRPDGTFNRSLAEYLDRKVPQNVNPVNGVYSKDVDMDRVTGLWSRIYSPVAAQPPPPRGNEHDEGTDTGSITDTGTNTGPRARAPAPAPADTNTNTNGEKERPIIIFFHGGSFAHSTADSAIYDALCRHLVTHCTAIVVSVNYRRAPEHTYPAPYEDGWTALKWVTSTAGSSWLRGGDTEAAIDTRRHVFLAGDSSGGNIAHHVARRAGECGMPVAGNILLNPMFGGERRTDSEVKLDGKYFVTLRDRDWYWKAFLPEGANRDHPACNPFGPHGPNLESVDFPRSLVVLAGLDMLQDWTLNYVQGLRRARKDVNLIFLQQATIGFYLLPNTHLFFHVMGEIKKFVSGSDKSSSVNRLTLHEHKEDAEDADADTEAEAEAESTS